VLTLSGSDLSSMMRQKAFKVVGSDEGNLRSSIVLLGLNAQSQIGLLQVTDSLDSLQMLILQFLWDLLEIGAL
jgi:hypothetical protein